MAEVKQELGFDVSQALAALDQLDRRLGRLNQSLEKVSQSQNKGKTAAQGLTVSFQTLARIVTTQLVVRAFGALQNALTDAITRAIDFQNVIAEISTIDIRGGEGFADIADDVERLSVAFGLDLGEVGKGLYQTISNQIAQTGDAAETAAGQIDFLNTAIKFGIAGVTTTESAVNLLAGTLNAFGEDVENTGRIAAQFFRTIELGRTTASELANSFGTVAPVAAKLGVSIEELQAAFATITISGVDTAKAATQIRGTFNSLLKPTEAMKVAFDQLGVANGEQLIDLFGFQGALEAVISTTDQSAEAVSKLIPRIRGLTGALILASEDGAEKYTANLQQIIQANNDLLDQKFELVFDTDARQFTRDLNELKILITRDFGEEVLETINEVIQAFGGFDTVSSAFSSLINTTSALAPAFALATAAIAALGTRSFFAATQVGVLTKSLGALGLVTSAAAFGQFLGGQIDDFLERDNKAIDDALKQRIEFQKRNSTLRQQNEEATNKLIEADFKRHLGGLAKANAGRITEARRTADQVRNANENAFSAILDASDELESQLRQQFRAREGQARTAVNNIKSLEGDLRDVRFDAQTRNLSDTQKFFALEERLAEENSRARNLLASEATQRGDTQAIDDTREALAETTDTARELQALASSLGINFEFRADTEAEVAIQSQINLEEELIRIIQRRRDAEKAAADEVAENNRQLKDLFVELVAAQNDVIDPEVDTSTQRERLNEFRKLQTEFAGLLSENDQIGAVELANFSNVLTSGGFKGILEDELTGAEIQQLSVAGTALEGVRDQLDRALEGFEADIGVNVIIAFRAAGFAGEASVKNLSEFFTNTRAEDELISGIQKNIQDLDNEIAAVVTNLTPLAQQIEDGLGQPIGGSFNILSEAKASLDAFNTAALAALRDGSITADELENLQARIRTAGQDFASLDPVRERIFDFRFQDQQDQAVQLANRIRQITDAEKERLEQQEALSTARENVTSDSDVARQEALNAVTSEEVQAIIDANEARQAERESTNQVTQASANAAEAVAVIPGIIGAATEEVNSLQAALNNLTVPDLNIGIGQAALASTGKLVSRLSKGGLPYLAGGGFSPRGTDTVPAMLSPGEFVVNARSTRRFFSQLQAINSGASPIFRQEGGPVTTFSGDINVTVGREQDASANGRTIARSIRRELRRGTSKLL